MPEDRPPKRAGTVIGDRDIRVPKTGKTPPQGYPIPPQLPAESWEGSDSYTPVAELLPDPIEVAAVRIDQRAEAIRERPGPTPPPEALQSALTIHGVRAELHGFAKTVEGKFDAVHKKIEGVSDLVVKNLVTELDRRKEEDHLVARGKIEVGTAADIAKIDVEAAKQKAIEAKRLSAAIAKVEVDAAKQKARIERRNKILLTALALAVALLEARHC